MKVRWTLSGVAEVDYDDEMRDGIKQAQIHLGQISRAAVAGGGGKIDQVSVSVDQL